MMMMCFVTADLLLTVSEVGLIARGEPMIAE